MMIILSKQLIQNDYNNSTVHRLVCAPVAQLVEHRVVTREVVSSTPAGPTLRVLQ